MVASLIGASKVTLTVDGNVLKRTEVATALRNTQKHAHAVVAPQKTFDERKVAAFRKFCTDFFDEGNTPKDPLELARHGADKLKGKLDELKATVSGSKYPFVEPALRPDRSARPGRRQARRLVPHRLQPRRRPARSQGEPHRPDPGVPQRGAAGRSTTRPSALLTTHSSNLGYLPPGSDATVTNALARPERLPRQQDGAAQAGRRRAAQPDRRGRRREPRRRSSRRSRDARPSCSASAYYAKATPEAQESVAAPSRPDDLARAAPRARSRSSARSDRTSSRATTRPARPARRVRSRAAVTTDAAAAEADRVGQDDRRPRRLRRARDRSRTSTSTSPPCVAHSSRP